MLTASTGISSGLVTVAGHTILSNVNVLGATYDSVSFSVSGQESNATDVFFRPDGLKMYVIGTSSSNAHEYDLSTAWNVSSAEHSASLLISAPASVPTAMFFRADGLKMYVVGLSNDTVYQYTLSTPWSITTASYESISFSVTTEEQSPQSVFFKPNGLSMYVLGTAADAVQQYTLSNAWDVSSAAHLQSFSIFDQEEISRGLSFVGDGSRMFVVGSNSDNVNEYNLSTPWDISTAVYVGLFSVLGQDGGTNGIYIKPDGTKMYIIGNATDSVYQYTVPSIDIQLTGPTSAAALDVQQDLNVYGKTTVANLTASLENYTEKVVPIGNSSTTKTISLTNGNVQTCTLTGNCVFTMPTAVAGKSFLLFLYTGAGSFTASFTSVKFPGGSAPTISTTASRTDLLSFISDGTSWFGSYVQNYS